MVSNIDRRAMLCSGCEMPDMLTPINIGQYQNQYC